jgi:hypothetical protein
MVAYGTAAYMKCGVGIELVLNRASEFAKAVSSSRRCAYHHRGGCMRRYEKYVQAGEPLAN